MVGHCCNSPVVVNQDGTGLSEPLWDVESIPAVHSVQALKGWLKAFLPQCASSKPVTNSVSCGYQAGAAPVLGLDSGSHLKAVPPDLSLPLHPIPDVLPQRLQHNG